jgi:tetratricopeptide (TPR) repeat protein
MPSLDELRRLLRADPADPFVLYAIAQEHAKRREWAPALEFYDRCLAADPAYCYAYFHKARALADSGDPPGALATLRAGLQASRRAGDPHAASEIQALLDELET